MAAGSDGWLYNLRDTVIKLAESTCEFWDRLAIVYLQGIELSKIVSFRYE